MKRYLIEEAKCGVSEGGMACGPVPGTVVASLKVNDGKRVRWLSLAEVDGIPNMIVTDEDIYDTLITDDFSDEFVDFVNDHTVNEFDGIEIDDGYYTTYGCIRENPDNPAGPVMKLLIALVRCDMDETEALIEASTGKYADEIDIPLCDMEEEYLEEQECEDEDEEE